MHRVLALAPCVLLLVASARADCDAAAPTMTGVGLPPVVDVSNGPVTFDCLVDARDYQTGLVSGSCSFLSPSMLQRANCTTTAIRSADDHYAADSYFRCPVTLPRYAEPGTWRLDSVTLVDTAGNSEQYSAYRPGAPWPGGASTVTVVDGTPDMSPPTVTAVTLSPASVNVSAAPAAVTCTMTVADAPAGVDVATCVLAAPLVPPPMTQQGAGCSATAPVSGTRQSGTFSCTVTIPALAAGGTWTIASATAIDLAGNISFPVPQFATVTVIDPAPDASAPSIVGASLAPLALAVSAAPQRLHCSVHVVDAGSGVQAVGCQVASPALDPQGREQKVSCEVTAPVSGSVNDGRYACDLVIPMSAAGGTWTGVAVANDAVGNSTTAFLPAVSVDCSSAYEVRIDVSRTQVFWTPTTGTYHGYRGDLPGLPGNGWGDCLGSTSSVWWLDDTTTPAPGAGFYYLVDYVAGTGEAGLGLASDGTPRIPQSACP